MAICLSTNCDLYLDKENIVLDHIDTLGLPIDGSKDIHDKLRGEGSFDNILYALKNSYAKSNIKYRIGTVVTKLNLEDLKNIAKILNEFSDRIVYWKLYEFVYYPGKGQNLRFQPQHHDTLFDIIKDISRYIPEEIVIYDTCERRNLSYFLIKPNGDVFVPYLDGKEPREVIVGNILGNQSELLLTWQKNIDSAGYEKPYRCIYRKDTELCKRFLSS